MPIWNRTSESKSWVIWKYLRLRYLAIFLMNWHDLWWDCSGYRQWWDEAVISKYYNFVGATSPKLYYSENKGWSMATAAVLTTQSQRCNNQKSLGKSHRAIDKESCRIGYRLQWAAKICWTESWRFNSLWRKNNKSTMQLGDAGTFFCLWLMTLRWH